MRCWGWALASSRTDDAWYRENLSRIDAYLVGAAIFRYPAVMGDRFRRAAPLEALAAGKAGAPFPIEQILAVARSGGLTGSRQAVHGLRDVAERARIADQNGWLLTSLAQRLPYALARPIDWDHIFPQAQASRMWTRGDGRRKHHRDRRLVNSAGNFWALDASVNRSLKDAVGDAKFFRLRTWLADADVNFPVQAAEVWSLTEEDIARHCEVDRLLTGDETSIDAAMAIFREVITSRSARLLDEALHRFPLARLFASDATDDGQVEIGADRRG